MLVDMFIWLHFGDALESGPTLTFDFPKIEAKQATVLRNRGLLLPKYTILALDNLYSYF